MKTVVHKWFWAWDFDREEAWLNDMARRGYALSSYSFCRYEFERCEPGEYGVRIELLEQPVTSPVSQQYIRFVEETGAEQVASYMRWVYFRKKRADGSFDLFSDLESRIKHLQRIWRLMVPLLVVNLICAFYNLFLYCQHHNPISLIFVLSLMASALLVAGMWRLGRKINRMKQDRQIVETPLGQREGFSMTEEADMADGSPMESPAAGTPAREDVEPWRTINILLLIAVCGLTIAALIFLGIAMFGKDDVQKGMLIPALLCETSSWSLNLARSHFMRKKEAKS